MESTVSRAFRMPKELDVQLKSKARDLGYLNPSEYIRYVLRKELEKETA